MKDVYTTNSHYHTYTSFLWKVGECTFQKLESERVNWREAVGNYAEWILENIRFSVRLRLLVEWVRCAVVHVARQCVASSLIDDIIGPKPCRVWNSRIYVAELRMHLRIAHSMIRRDGGTISTHCAVPVATREPGPRCKLDTVSPLKVANPVTPRSDQFQISPSASPEILHHTVWRTWLFIAYSDERLSYWQFSLPHSYITL